MKSEARPLNRGADKFALDSSCLVALFSEWHDRHQVTVAAYQARIKRGQPLIISAHAALECFLVLTRLPAPLSATPAAVEQVLASYIASGAEIAGLTAADCRFALTEFARRGIGGGRICDGVIALTSFRAGASELLTWNLAHFLLVAPAGLTVREPA